LISSTAECACCVADATEAARVVEKRSVRSPSGAKFMVSVRTSLVTVLAKSVAIGIVTSLEMSPVAVIMAKAAPAPELPTGSAKLVSCGEADAAAA